MPGKLTIGQVKGFELTEVVQFALAARTVTFPGFFQGSGMPEDLVAFERVYLHGGCFLIARHQGRIVGSVGYRAYDRRFEALQYPGLKVVEVVRLFVLPEHRKGGLASALYTTLQRHAQQAGVQVMYLHTHAFLPGAVSFWQRQGFEVTALDPDPLWQTVHMQLDLQSPRSGLGDVS